MSKPAWRISGLDVRFGGEEHSGWLPPGASRPPPTPVEHLVLDLEILEEEGSGGYLLCWSSRDGTRQGDLWFEAPADARKAAASYFGAPEDRWEQVAGR